MDGNNLSSLPATPTPPSFAAMLEEMQRAREVAQGGVLGSNAMSAPQAMPSASALTAPVIAPTPTISQEAGISALELLEELRTGQLVAEQAFLARARQAMAMPGNVAAPAANPVPAPTLVTRPTIAEAPRPVIAVAPVPRPENKAATLQPDETVAPVTAPNAEKHLIVSLGEGRYAVPMEHIIEIAELTQYTPVPNVPEWIAGIVNLRGDILSLIDLNALQGEAADEISRGSSLLVAQTRGGDLTTCFIVARVYGVANVTPDQIQMLDQVMNQGLSAFSRGFVADGGELVCLLDVESLLRSLEFKQ